MQCRLVPARLVVVFLLAGCSSSNTGKIEGTKWVSKAGTVGKEKLKEGQIMLDFAADGTVRASVFQHVVAGKYTLGTGEKVTLEFDDDFLGEKSHRVRISIEGDSLKMSDASDALVFTRKAAATVEKKE